MELGESLLESNIRPFLANFYESKTLRGFSNNQYPFDMKFWTEANNNAFAIKIIDMYCSLIREVIEIEMS